MTDSTTRFSNRVEDYIKYRPSYPPEILEVLKTQCGLGVDSKVADIGSGTGILTELLLATGCTVYAVEPNEPMRLAGERQCVQYPGFTSIAGTAEQTTLASNSIDLITAGQAFHWFAPVETHKEFTRTLKPGGSVAILWNKRRKDSTPYLRDYEQLLIRYGTDYTKVQHDNIVFDDMEKFFHPAVVHFTSFPYTQRFGFDGVRGRLLSSSYIPDSGEPGYDEMLRELEIIFDRHSVNGLVDIEYDTELYYGKW